MRDRSIPYELNVTSKSQLVSFLTHTKTQFLQIDAKMHTKSVFITAATALALAGIATTAPAPYKTDLTNPSYVYPNIADISHATPSLADFLHKYFTSKTLRDFTTFASYFISTNKAVYFDATAGLVVPQSQLAAELAAFLNTSNPDAKSYPLKIIGDMNSATVLSVDTPGLFGAGVRGISAVNFNKQGKILRWIDYWDGRLNPNIAQRTPANKFPKTFGESSITTEPNPVIEKVAAKLHAGLSTGDPAAVASLLSFDAVFEDRSTHTRIEGRPGIEQYLHRALSDAPYGKGSKVRHVVGNLQGGAYEWIGNSKTGSPNGITALELDYEGRITSLFAMWDASRTSNKTVEALVNFAIAE